MSATATLRLVAPFPERPLQPVRDVEPIEQVIKVTVESDDRLLLTVAEAAHRLGIGRTLMYELLGCGEVDSVHVGRLHKVPADALTVYVDRQRNRE